MRQKYIFWEQALRIDGPCEARVALQRLQAALVRDAMTLSERLAGVVDGDSLRVWRAGPFLQAGDVVEFRGTLRPNGEGTLIEGTLRYKWQSKVQFLGLFAFGVVIMLAGLFQASDIGGMGRKVVGIGAAVSVGTALWIYASRQMNGKQIEFIEQKLREVVAG